MINAHRVGSETKVCTPVTEAKKQKTYITQQAETSPPPTPRYLW